MSRESWAWVSAMKYPLRLSVLLVAGACVCAGFAPQVRGAVPQDPSTAEVRSVESRAAATATIPGPLRSFLRIAGISQKASNEELIALLARNVYLIGYQGNGLGVRPTEFLVLLRRYVQQARELAALAGQDGAIHVSGCDDAKQLLAILGYRTEATCGQHGAFVETADPRRAFLTIDSGFPLPELEATLQGGKPFVYPYPSSQVPIFLTEKEWVAASVEGGKEGRTLVDALLHDPSLARLYYAWAHIDPETEAALLRSPGLKKLVPFAASLDFYGDYIRIRSGRVIVPGGEKAEPVWKDLVGGSPQSPGDFVPRLLAKDNGWLAVYFDSLSRVPPEQQAHFVEPARLKPCYEALRGKSASPSATAPVFRPDPTLLLLLTRLQWEPNGEPHVPGSLQTWKNIRKMKSNSDIAHNWNGETKTWKNSDGLLETMIALSRVDLEGGPTDAFLVLTEVDAKRPAGRKLSAATVELMGAKFAEFRNQYSMFAEFPDLSDASITDFLTTATAVGKISDHTLRGNAMGIFEANVALWQILARQGEIPASAQDSSWQGMIKPFGL